MAALPNYAPRTLPANGPRIIAIPICSSTSADFEQSRLLRKPNGRPHRRSVPKRLVDGQE